MPLTLADLFASPDHYLHRFDGDAAVFVPMDRAAYQRSIFLDARIAPAATQEMRLPVAALVDPPRAPATAWIFHVAHCGSTLLARALDDAGASLVLREPQALRQAAVTGDATRLALAAAMIGRRYRADSPTLVKANVPVNFVLPTLRAFDPEARAILLYLPLDDYVLAVLRSAPHRDWLRRVTTQLAPHLGDLSACSDAQRAAALWHAQMDRFADAVRTMPGARTLDAERFHADPAVVLKAAAAHLGPPIDGEVLERTASGPLFATYSKNPGVAFDNDARLARRDELRRTLADEVAVAREWRGNAASLPTVSDAALV